MATRTKPLWSPPETLAEELVLDGAAAAELGSLRAELRAWLTANVPGEPEPEDETERFRFRRDWQRTLFEGGWAGISWPKRYGGRGAGPLEQFVYYEELARAEAPDIVNRPGIVLVGPTMMAHAADEVKDRFLPGILSGDDIWCQGFSEPAAGSDLAGLQTRATRDGDSYEVDGQKVWTTWAQFADYCAVLCRTDRDAERHRGLSMIVVPMDQPGVTQRPIVQITREAEFGEVFFDSARAPAGWVIGEPGDGWGAAMTMLEFERGDQGFTDHGRLFVKLAGLAGVLRAARDDGRLGGDALARARAAFADVWSRCVLLRQFNLGLAARLAGGARVGFDGSLAKLYWSELEQSVAELGLLLAGPDGLLDGDWTADYLRSRATTIYSGTSEIQRNIVAEKVLGLPR
jgi:alkylation response protein AidB-like acyl-CoA dehydrogenase